MSIEQAMGIAKNAQQTAKEAASSANEAIVMAKIMETKHNEHEKTCSQRYEEIVKTNAANAEIFKGVHNKIDTVNRKLFNGLVCLVGGMCIIIGTLLGIIFYGKPI